MYLLHQMRRRAGYRQTHLHYFHLIRLQIPLQQHLLALAQLARSTRYRLHQPQKTKEYRPSSVVRMLR